MYMMHVATDASMQIFPPNNGGDRGTGYQTVGGPTGMFSNFCYLERVVSLSGFSLFLLSV